MKRYFAKADTWFKEGTEAFRLEEIYPVGVLFDNHGKTTSSATYSGIYVVGSCDPEGYDEYWYKKGYKNGDEVVMNEHCCDDEFDVVEQ